MGLTKEEKETIIRFDESSDVVSVYSCSSSVWNKCIKAGLKIVKHDVAEGVVVAKWFTGKKKQIGIKKIRVLNEEQKTKLREQLRR